MRCTDLWQGRSDRERCSRAMRSAPVSAEAVILPLAPTFTVATANAPVLLVPGVHHAIIAERCRQGHDVGNRGG